MDIESDVRLRVIAEYREMPGLRLTSLQAGRLCGLDHTYCAALLEKLVAEGLLQRTAEGHYVAPSES